MSVNRYSSYIPKDLDRWVIIYDTETGRGIRCLESFGDSRKLSLVEFLEPSKSKEIRIEGPLYQELTPLLISPCDFLAKLDDLERRSSYLKEELDKYLKPSRREPQSLFEKEWGIPLEVNERLSEEENYIKEEINSLR